MLLGERGRLDRDQMGKLAEKYNITGFMYTEYPHKSFWSPDLRDGQFRIAVKDLFSKDRQTPLLLYVHIPYCEQLCWFCTCHISITSEYQKVHRYLEFLFREIDLLRSFSEQMGITPNFREIHLGGGSPTYVSEEDFDKLMEKLGALADLEKLDEISIEIDPRKVDRKRMVYYPSKGINRISFGVQDFDIEVQKAINRPQPPELIENLITPDIRSRFKNGVNFDLLCGLPHQTPETMRKTCEKAAEMSPDRICLNYVHYAPRFAPHQKLMFDGRNGRPNRLPNFYERKMIFLEALKVLTQKGYVRTGYDHFAKPTDAVAIAMREKKMEWNSLGVTAGRYTNVLGLGVSSLMTVGDYYFQNFYELADYERSIEEGRFPIYRGFKLNRDDRIRRTVIHSLRNFFSVDFGEIERHYSIHFKEYFAEELLSLNEFIADGIVERSDTSVTITELGHQFASLVCRNFDKFYTDDKKTEDVGAFYKEGQTIAGTSSEIEERLKTWSS